MTLTKKTKIGIGIAAGLVITTALGLWYSYTNKLLFWEEKPFVPDPNVQKEIDNKATVQGKPKITWRNDSFPLSLGSKGQNVKNLQAFLKIEDDGYFGYDTLTAVKAKFNSEIIENESKFKPAASPTTAAFTKGQEVYAKGIEAKIYSIPHNSGRIGFIKPYTKIGIYEAKSSELGWSKVKTTGYYRIVDGLVYGTNEEFYQKSGTYFVPTAQITDTPA